MPHAHRTALLGLVLALAPRAEAFLGVVNGNFELPDPSTNGEVQGWTAENVVYRFNSSELIPSKIEVLPVSGDYVICLSYDKDAAELIPPRGNIRTNLTEMTVGAVYNVTWYERDRPGPGDPGILEVKIGGCSGATISEVHQVSETNWTQNSARFKANTTYTELCFTRPENTTYTKQNNITDGSILLDDVKATCIEGPSTEEPSEAPTDSPSEAPSDAPTEVPTESPSDAPTDALTDAPTEAPSESATESPSDAPSEAPTEAATEPTGAPDGPPTPPNQAPTVVSGESFEGLLVLSGLPSASNATGGRRSGYAYTGLIENSIELYLGPIGGTQVTVLSVLRGGSAISRDGSTIKYIVSGIDASQVNLLIQKMHTEMKLTRLARILEAGFAELGITVTIIVLSATVAGVEDLSTPPASGSENSKPWEHWAFLAGAGLVAILMVGVVAWLLRRKCQRSSEVAACDGAGQDWFASQDTPPSQKYMVDTPELTLVHDFTLESSPNSLGMTTERVETMAGSDLHQGYIQNPIQQTCTSPVWGAIPKLLGPLPGMQSSMNSTVTAIGRQLQRTCTSPVWAPEQLSMGTIPTLLGTTYSVPLPGVQSAMPSNVNAIGPHGSMA